MCEISVIVPVYNAERFIEPCVRSILKQTFVDFELILVNDGSSDKSSFIIDNLAKTDNRISVIHQSNSGEMSARATGVRNSKGTFLYFVDADDEISPETLSSMYSYMNDGVDIVVFEQDETRCLTMENYAARVLSFKCLTVWGKLYRRNVWDEYVFAVPVEFKVGGDFLTQLRLLRNIKKEVVLVNEFCYHYNTNNINSVQKNHIYSYEYERMMILEVKKTMAPLISNLVIKNSLIKWELVYLGGMIGLQYPINFDDCWIKELKKDCENCQLTLKERLIVKSIDFSVLRIFWIIEKKTKLFLRKLLKR